MKFFKDIERLVSECISYKYRCDNGVSIITDYYTTLDIINCLIKKTKYTLTAFDVLFENVNKPFVIDIDEDEIWVSSAINPKNGKYFPCNYGRVYVEDTYADKFPKDNDVEIVKFKIGAEQDYSICVEANKKGFCYCQNLGDKEYEFTYHSNKEMTDEEIYKIIDEYVRSLY